MTSELIRLSMQHFQDIIFMQTQIYRKVFKYALVYLQEN